MKEIKNIRARLFHQFHHTPTLLLFLLLFSLNFGSTSTTLVEQIGKEKSVHDIQLQLLHTKPNEGINLVSILSSHPLPRQKRSPQSTPNRRNSWSPTMSRSKSSGSGIQTGATTIGRRQSFQTPPKSSSLLSSPNPSRQNSFAKPPIGSRSSTAAQPKMNHPKPQRHSFSSFMSKIAPSMGLGSWRSKPSSSSSSARSGILSSDTSSSSFRNYKEPSTSSSASRFSKMKSYFGFGPSSKSDLGPTGVSKAERKFMKNPDKFLKKNIVTTRDPDGPFAGKGPIQLKTGSVYDFGLKQLPGISGSKKQYFLTVKPEGHQGIKGTWLGTKERTSANLNSKAPFIFTPEFSGCTLFAGCNSRTGKVDAFHHHRRFNNNDPVKTETITTKGFFGKKKTTHKVTHPDGKVQYFSKAMKFETYGNQPRDHPNERLGFAFIHKRPSGKVKMSYQRYMLTSMTNIKQNHFQSSKSQHSKVGKIPQEFMGTSRRVSTGSLPSIIGSRGSTSRQL